MSSFRIVVLAAFVACGPRTGSPLGQAILVVDTDLTVPKLASRLRVDVYAESGAWIASNDFAAPDPKRWPLTFGVHLEKNSPTSTALVRMRVYPDGHVRDYRGERFIDRAKVNAQSTRAHPPPSTFEPRLVIDGSDYTPLTEPEPLLAVDRLVRVRLEAGKVGSVRVTMRAACAGTMADVAGARTCIETEKVLVPVELAALDPELDPGSSIQGTFESPYTGTPCSVPPRVRRTATDGTPLYDEDICVPGGVLVFGSHDVRGGVIDDFPEHLAVVPPFLMDRFEVTVGRMRQAIADGFAMRPYENSGPLPSAPMDPSDARMCTFTKAPVGQEELPLNCVEWSLARAFCNFIGADLPWEVQLQYAAVVAGRPERVRYPWGNDLPETPWCAGVTYLGSGTTYPNCGFGPAAVRERTSGDVTPDPMRIVDLAASMSEAMRDAPAPLDADCWLASSLVLPRCDVLLPAKRMARASNWRATDPLPNFRAVYDGYGSTTVGFRCAREGIAR